MKLNGRMKVRHSNTIYTLKDEGGKNIKVSWGVSSFSMVSRKTVIEELKTGCWKLLKNRWL